MIDYKLMQQKILVIVRTISDKIKRGRGKIDEKEFLKSARTKAIERRQELNRINWRTTKKELEKIGKLKKDDPEGNRATMYNYIESCNDDDFLMELIELLAKIMVELRILYIYDGYEEDDEEKEDERANWFA